MKKFDFLSGLGVLIALIAIVGGYYLEGGSAGSLWEFAALVIVIGGTLGAIMLQTPFDIFSKAIKLSIWVFFPPRLENNQLTADVLRWSAMVKKEGLAGVEIFIQQEKDPFTKKALKMLVDGDEPDTIKDIMEVDIITKEKNYYDAVKVFEGMGGYSPTIGILGAVLGLIHVMTNLQDPSKLGTGIATAFVATIYGIGLANLVFLPIAQKLRTIIEQEMQTKELLIDSIVSIARGEHLHNIENKLKGYFSQLA